MKPEELREGMRFLVGDGNCVEYAGVGKKGDTIRPPKIEEAEDGTIIEVEEAVVEEQADEEQVADHAMFDMFDTGKIYLVHLDEVEEAMDRWKFELLSFPEWRRRIVAYHAYKADPKKYDDYRGFYHEMKDAATDDEIMTMYNATLK